MKLLPTEEVKRIIRKECIDICKNQFLAYLATHSEGLVVIEHRDRVNVFGSFMNELWGELQEELHEE